MTLRNTIYFLLGALGAVLSQGCRTSIPRWEGKIYAGDSGNAAISRAQSNEVISCASPEVDKFICMTGDDFKSFYDTYILGCRQWGRGTPMMSVTRARAILAAAHQNNSVTDVSVGSDGASENLLTENRNSGEEALNQESDKGDAP